MSEARDQLAARRAAYAWVYRLGQMNAWPEATQAQIDALWVMMDAIREASLVEDADLSALEDGDPVPGKCQDEDCPGPHLLPRVCRCGVAGSATARSGEHCERFGLPAHGVPCPHDIATGGCGACDSAPHLLPERRKA